MSSNFVTVGSKFPDFNKKSVVSLEKGKEFQHISNKYIDGK